MSKKDSWYRQCCYETDPDESGKQKRGVSWIPEKLAEVGKRIYFGEKARVNDTVTSGKPREMWTVTEVWARAKESFLVEHRMDYKNMRKVSDV